MESTLLAPQVKLALLSRRTLVFCGGSVIAGSPRLDISGVYRRRRKTTPRAPTGHIDLVGSV
jgi:hypothetical protein